MSGDLYAMEVFDGCLETEFDAGADEGAGMDEDDGFIGSLAGDSHQPAAQTRAIAQPIFSWRPITLSKAIQSRSMEKSRIGLGIRIGK